ncbi:DUF2835 domain-containing protein [Photobacterium sanctipauli]|uniref:DUF2835 domain-containing protein n=1 Tax=Photobacterium sanctipauli TaxID=1342794 RepID=A0A2T3NIG1_9GAMM|nr:DUF2835 domain-containing protein [Photobacterium sanctipauli]PSW14817.1 DUF2835 domain-containing protein [Photobacterium sanctipauli]
MKSFTFSAYISYNDFLNHYSGVAATVVVRTDNGLKLQLPASRFRPFLTQIGVKGRFRVTVNQDNRLQGIEQIA